MHNNYGLFYIDKDGQKYFYRSYLNLDLLYQAIQNDEDFKKIDKKEVIVIYLEDSSYN